MRTAPSDKSDLSDVPDKTNSPIRSVLLSGAPHTRQRPKESCFYASFANFSVPSTLVNFQPSQSPPLIAVP